MNLSEFKEYLLNLKGHRKHKITNSIGNYFIYKIIRKNKWYDIPRPLTEKEFYSIIRTINNKLADKLVKGNSIKLPNKMGTLELRKYEAKFNIKDGKLKTNLPIDWDKTIKLWYEDEESYENKTLIKIKEKEMFKVCYNKKIANYCNKTLYAFQINRDIKKRLKSKIHNKEIDAFKL